MGDQKEYFAITVFNDEGERAFEVDEHGNVWPLLDDELLVRSCRAEALKDAIDVWIRWRREKNDAA